MRVCASLSSDRSFGKQRSLSGIGRSVNGARHDPKRDCFAKCRQEPNIRAQLFIVFAGSREERTK